MNSNVVYFARLAEDVNIPSKITENAGYDIYAHFQLDYIILKPHTTRMIPTGLISAFSSDYVMILKERSSTGKLGIAQRSGIIDSGYRGEWMVPITNTSDKLLWIDKRFDKTDEDDYGIHYPYSKAICQAILVSVPNVKIAEISAEEVRTILSIRGTGINGSSGK